MRDSYELFDTATGSGILHGSLALCKAWLPVFIAAGVTADIRKIVAWDVRRVAA